MKSRLLLIRNYLMTCTGMKCRRIFPWEAIVASLIFLAYMIIFIHLYSKCWYMKKIAFNIQCSLGENNHLILVIPSDLSPAKLRKWNRLHRAWVLQQLMKTKAKSITIWQTEVSLSPCHVLVRMVESLECISYVPCFPVLNTCRLWFMSLAALTFVASSRMIHVSLHWVKSCGGTG